MPHVITQSCCGDASCVYACPVNAIHPNPKDPAFVTAEMLYIDPNTCVDCGACVVACPVGAISSDTLLKPSQLPFLDINAAFHVDDAEARPVQAAVPTTVKISRRHELRVAIVGSGPAGLYAADELLKQPGVSVTVYDRLPTPYGLVRTGVAPDHPDTRSITRLFRQIENLPGFAYALGIDVGSDVTHEDLLRHHHAVVYATGASLDRKLGIDGEELAGSDTATAFVAWYNGHPDYAHRSFDLSAERAVLIGNGNVALDVARILATNPRALAKTDIADTALRALSESSVTEIVVLGRRGPAQAAFSLPELQGLASRSDIDLVVDGNIPVTPPESDPQLALKLALLRGLPDAKTPRDERRRIVLRFLAMPSRLVGNEKVSGIELRPTELTSDGVARIVDESQPEILQAGLVLRSIGYRGVPVSGLPFDSQRHVIPHAEGRVEGVASTFVVGWIKRGPSGYIGTNKSCARETTNNLLRDFNSGLLGSPDTAEPLPTALERLHPSAIDLNGWRRIDAEERLNGRLAGRPRIKLTDPRRMGELVAAGPRDPLPDGKRGRLSALTRSRAKTSA